MMMFDTDTILGFMKIAMIQAVMPGGVMNASRIEFYDDGGGCHTYSVENKINIIISRKFLQVIAYDESCVPVNVYSLQATNVMNGIHHDNAIRDFINVTQALCKCVPGVTNEIHKRLALKEEK